MAVAHLINGLDDSPHSDGVWLLKLHGSTSWGILKDDPKKIVPLNLGSILNNMRPTVGQHLTWPTSQFLRKREELTGEPVIVPPTWNKADSHRGLEKVWSRAARELSEAENIFVIGYSMPETDSFFRHLYALGTVGKAMLRRFWVFNPDSSLEARFRSLLGPAAEDRFQYHPEQRGMFDRAIEHIKNTFPT